MVIKALNNAKTICKIYKKFATLLTQQILRLHPALQPSPCTEGLYGFISLKTEGAIKYVMLLLELMNIFLRTFWL